MNPMWTVWYMGFILFVVILPAQRRRSKRRALRQRKKGIKMTNEWAQKLVGKDVWLYGDNYSFKGVVKNVFRQKNEFYRKMLTKSIPVDIIYT